MKTMVILKMRRGKPCEIRSGTLDELALHLIRNDYPKAAKAAATSKGQIGPTDFRYLDEPDARPLMECGCPDIDDGWYLSSLT